MGNYSILIDRVQERGDYDNQKAVYWARKAEGLRKMTQKINVSNENRDVAELLEKCTLELFVPPTSLCDTTVKS